MLWAGVGWGVYSLRGKQAQDPVQMTAGNFVRTVPLTLVLSGLMARGMSLDLVGCLYAIASGSLASGLGYTLWYAALKDLKATSAATVQLTVPIIAAGGGAILLNEPLTLNLLLAASAILGGIALAILAPHST